MGRVSKSIGGVVEEAQELVQPKTHKKYLGGGNKITEPQQPWQKDLQQKFQSCSDSGKLKQLESKPQDLSIEVYRTLLKDLEIAHCTWSAIQDHSKSGNQIGHARETEKAKKAQWETVTTYLKGLEDAYKAIDAP